MTYFNAPKAFTVQILNAVATATSLQSSDVMSLFIIHCYISLGTGPKTKGFRNIIRNTMLTAIYGLQCNIFSPFYGPLSAFSNYLTV